MVEGLLFLDGQKYNVEDPKEQDTYTCEGII